jgi:hypothetical protein
VKKKKKMIQNAEVSQAAVGLSEGCLSVDPAVMKHFRQKCNFKPEFTYPGRTTHISGM